MKILKTEHHTSVADDNGYKYIETSNEDNWSNIVSLNKRALLLHQPPTFVTFAGTKQKKIGSSLILFVLSFLVIGIDFEHISVQFLLKTAWVSFQVKIVATVLNVSMSQPESDVSKFLETGRLLKLD
jgi:hypothetical protein